MSRARGRRGAPTRALTTPGDVVGVVVSNLLLAPLAVLGLVDLPLLVSGYVVEAVIAAALLLPLAAGAGSLGDTALLRFTLPLLPLLLGAGALAAVDWSWTSLGVLLGSVALLLAGPARTLWRTGVVGAPAGRGRAAPPYSLGQWGWQLALIGVGALVAVPYAADLTLLSLTGWESTNPGDVPAAGLGHALNSLVLGSPWAPATAATVLFIGFRTLNEGGVSLRRALSDARRQGTPT